MNVPRRSRECEVQNGGQKVKRESFLEVSPLHRDGISII